MHPWGKLSRGFVVSPSLEVLNTCLDKATADRIQRWQKPHSKWEVELDDLQRSFSAIISVILWSASLLQLWLLTLILQQASPSTGWSNSKGRHWEIEGALLLFYLNRRKAALTILFIFRPECPQFLHVLETLFSSFIGLNLGTDFWCLVWLTDRRCCHPNCQNQHFFCKLMSTSGR